MSADDLVEYFDYLDDLRESGITNMYGGAPYLVRKFGIEIRVAREVLSKWMATFDGKTSLADRVSASLTTNGEG